ncbi:SRPBCC domain-containing protein [Cyanobium gracile]|uniref:SRPBCC domain-containing protein n=1 Tax=Cyanobium gracile TaxID=59930 RepID=UPI00090055F2
MTIEVHVAAPNEEVWKACTSPAYIQQWNAASEDWHCPSAEIDLSPSRKFSYCIRLLRCNCCLADPLRWLLFRPAARHTQGA